MDNGLKVVITYKNQRLEDVSTREYGFDEYTEMLKLDLLKVISDVEDLVYTLTGGKQKAEWPDDAALIFNKVKHKLLDKCGEISRLPENLRGVKPLSEFMGEVLRGRKLE